MTPRFRFLITAASIGLLTRSAIAELPERPNIVWIVAEDASPHIGCYGETTIETPHLDQLAADGVKFTRAFVTCPVCSPSRSAMISGMYQTTLGAHNHRSQRSNGRWEGVPNLVASYTLPDSIRLIPRLFSDAGYFVVNGGRGKTDYNFTTPEGLYDGADWTARADGQPFFAQFQLRGGKNRRAKVDQPVDPADVLLPPYYPDHPVLRADWARYLNSWIAVDNEVGEIVSQLEREGELENTVIFFWTDHGISHARGKQFLYEEGIRVPLLVRFPDGHLAETVREDLVLQIDVAATSLDLCGIEVPENVQGRSLFSDGFRRRRHLFAARDRCDETVEIMRCVRTPRFKFIRNFLPHVSHMQPNQYKDGKEIIQTMRSLHDAGELTELQDLIFRPTRPPEELYDLESDPNETLNLLTSTRDDQRAYKDTANSLRLALYQWMIDSGDVGLIPEPVLEELGAEAGSKILVRDPDHDSRLMWAIIETIEAGERSDEGGLIAALNHDHPAVRWWAATGLGNTRNRGVRVARDALTLLLTDDSAGVRVAAAQALCQLGAPDRGLPVLEAELTHENFAVGMYAIRGLEMLGPTDLTPRAAIEAAVDSPYEFTRRIARRFAGRLAEGE